MADAHPERPLSEEPMPLTILLQRWRNGDREAGERLVASVYSELRRLAAHYLRGERAHHTLSSTDLVHELYIRLAASQPVDWQSRSHFFAIAAQQLRRLLVNYARDRQALKRGGKQVRLALTEVNGLEQPREQDVLDVDAALARLEALDERAARVVELRFFGGLTESEAAEALGISVATVKRDWTFARAWLSSNILPSAFL